MPLFSARRDLRGGERGNPPPYRNILGLHSRFENDGHESVVIATFMVYEM